MFVISLICAAQFVLQLDFSIVNVALPSIQLGAVLAGYVYFASLYLQKVLGFSPVLPGLVLTAAGVGLAILATAAAAATDGHGGSLADGYRLSFPIATGLAVLAAIIVAPQLSSKSHRVSKSDRVEPGHQQAGPGGPPPAPPAPAQLGKS